MSAVVEWREAPVQISRGQLLCGAAVEKSTLTGWTIEGLPFAVTPGVRNFAGYWVVTHRRSGVATAATKDLDRAKACAEELATIGDWNRPAKLIQKDTAFCNTARAVIERVLDQKLPPRGPAAYLPDEKSGKVTRVNVPKEAQS